MLCDVDDPLRDLVLIKVPTPSKPTPDVQCYGRGLHAPYAGLLQRQAEVLQ
jgi:hypothetical protein